MFYQVRILDRYGKVKKVVSKDELRKAHWNRFDENKKSYVMPKKKSFEVIESIEPSEVSLQSSGDQV
jgi:hypothetical protein